MKSKKKYRFVFLHFMKKLGIKKNYSFIWLHQVLVVACGISDLHCSMQDLFYLRYVKSLATAHVKSQ